MVVDRRGQQVDRIPNASMLQQTVKACQHRHGHAACEAPFNSCGYRIYFEWEQRPGKFWRHEQPFDFPAGWNNRGRFRFDLYYLFLFKRENLPEPADAASDSENRSENAN